MQPRDLGMLQTPLANRLIVIGGGALLLLVLLLRRRATDLVKVG